MKKMEGGDNFALGPCTLPEDARIITSSIVIVIEVNYNVFYNELGLVFLITQCVKTARHIKDQSTSLIHTIVGLRSKKQSYTTIMTNKAY